MNAGDSDIRSRYLALALDARRIMDALVPFAETGQRNQFFETAVQEAISALAAVTEGTGANAVRSSLAFDEYEQVLTLDEIKNQQERRAVVSDLQRLAAADDREAQHEAAMRVLEFFFAVESRALYYYSRPPAMPSYAT